MKGKMLTLVVLATVLGFLLLLGNLGVNRAVAGQLEFDSGIGFYCNASIGRDYSNNKLVLLKWTSGERPRDALTVSEKDFELYSYGLDFSNMTVPPHLLGFGLQCLHSLNEEKPSGRWPAYFLPLEGYSQPTYRVVLDPLILSEIKSGKSEYKIFGLKTLYPTMGGPEGTYWFVFLKDLPSSGPSQSK